MSEDEHRHTARRRFEELEQDAIEVEIETGHIGETVAEAKRHIVLRIGRVVLGFVVLVAGLVMLPLPGPGMLTIAAGLALLASDIPFAHRLLQRVRRRLPADADGRVPRRVVFGGLVVSAAAIACSAWWTSLR